METNRRRFLRAKYPCSLTLWQNGKFETIMTSTSNLGAGGLLIYMDQSFMIGAKIEIKIDFSDKESFQCNGLVLRCQEGKEDLEEKKGDYSIAIVFEGLDESQVAYLKQKVEGLLEGEDNN